MSVTAAALRDLWDNPDPDAVIDRGDDYAPVTKGALGALASGIDTDDEGYPLDDQWELLADQLTGDVPGEPTDSAGQDILQEITSARLARDQAEDQFGELLRSAMAARRAPVTAMAQAAGLSRERLYQIRDGRR